MIKKVKVKVDFQDFYEGFIETSRRKDLKNDLKIEIEGEPVEGKSPTYSYNVGDIVFVKHYYDTTSYGWRDTPRILGGRWGRVIDTNINSPKRTEEGEVYFIRGSKSYGGGWEKLENVELIS